MSLDDDYDAEVTVLYRKDVGKVHGYLVNTGTDPGLAEEIADDAFEVARRNWDRVRSYDRPESYVFTIARNERSKRQKDHYSTARELHPDPPEPLRHVARDPAQGVVDRIVLQHALQQLPPSLREAIALRDVEDLAEDTTAEIMNISVGAVKRYTFEGRRRLRDLLPEFRHAGEEGPDQ